MPLEYWLNACATAAYLINRLPTPTLKNACPYSKLFGVEPNYIKLRSFGCLCYPWLKPYASHKLDLKSSPCVFLGHSATQSAYYCLDLQTHKMYCSRHVHFVENKFPFSELYKPTVSLPDLIEEWCSFSITTISPPQHPHNLSTSMEISSPTSSQSTQSPPTPIPSPLPTNPVSSAAPHQLSSPLPNPFPDSPTSRNDHTTTHPQPYNTRLAMVSENPSIKSISLQLSNLQKRHLLLSIHFLKQ